MNISREALRARLRRTREALGASEQLAASREIVAPVVSLVSEHVDDTRAGVVAGYLPTHGELDPRSALEALIGRGWTVVLPICGPAATMRFAPWRPGDDLVENRYGIPEPTSLPIADDRIDVVLVPGVGFSTDGSRIGHGVGYYDRYFAECNSLGHDPFRIGVAHDVQVVKLPPPESWDVRMHSVITPSRVLPVDG